MYAAVFASSYATSVGAGAHNTLLQSVLDVGYVGALLQLVLLWQLLSAFGRTRTDSPGTGPWASVGLSATMALIFIGLTGETLSIVTPNTLVLFLALNIHRISFQDSRIRTNPDAPDGSPAPAAVAEQTTLSPPAR